MSSVYGWTEEIENLLLALQNSNVKKKAELGKIPRIRCLIFGKPINSILKVLLPLLDVIGIKETSNGISDARKAIRSTAAALSLSWSRIQLS